MFFFVTCIPSCPLIPTPMWARWIMGTSFAPSPAHGRQVHNGAKGGREGVGMDVVQTTVRLKPPHWSVCSGALYLPISSPIRELCAVPSGFTPTFFPSPHPKSSTPRPTTNADFEISRALTGVMDRAGPGRVNGWALMLAGRAGYTKTSYKSGDIESIIVERHYCGTPPGTCER